jgi:protein-disulfide isomerase
MKNLKQKVRIKKIRFFTYVIGTIVLVSFTFISLRQSKVIKKDNKAEVEIIEHELDIVYGKDSVDLTIFLFSNYSCSFCRKFFAYTYPKLKEEYIDKGKVKLVVKPVDLTNNENVKNSLKIAVCINEYGKFEKLNRLLLFEPKVIYTEEFSDLIEEFIEKDEFVAECMLGGEADEYIIENILNFKALNLTGTPTFIINNKIYKGYSDYKNFKKLVEKELQYSLH